MFDELCSWDNLYAAWHGASRGKRGRWAAASFEHDLEDNLFQLQDELRNQTYRPGPYYSFYIHEPKRRLISAAPFRDRVVHHALCNVIEPIFERSFISDSYANRVGKGTHRALDRCQHFARQYRYALQCDLKQFFPAIDHEMLRRSLAQKVHDPQVMFLVDRILGSGVGILSDAYDMVWFEGDDLFASNRPRGLPIGNLTSQFWANCYLNAFDHFIKRELGCAAYLRFVDDFVLFADDKPTLWRWHSAIVDRLASLRLTIHPIAQPRPVSEGIPFLGFVVWPQRRRIKGRKVVHFRRTLAQRLKAHTNATLGLAEVTATVQGWLNHVRYANTTGCVKATLRRFVVRPVGQKQTGALSWLGAAAS